MKLFMATLATETNTFSPMPTGEAGFKGGRDWFRDDGSRHPPAIGNIPLIAWRQRGEADGVEIVESICTFAQPAGTTLRHVYEELRDTLLDDLRGAVPLDSVLLFMHGAMVAEGYDDCEGDTLARVREIVGPDVVIGIELDLHCHLTEAMRVNADVMITYKEYPHIDMVERAHELYTLVARAVRREIRPVIAYHDCRMVAMWRTPLQPMRGFVDRMSSLEGHDGILSVSFGHGFPWGDVEEVGAKMVVVADGDMARAEALAAQLGQEIWDLRERTLGHHDSIDEAIDHVAHHGGHGLIVLADVADNAGAGAPSDNTEILARLVERGVKGAVIGCFWDPVAVGFCAEAGEGATFMLRIGGKCGVASGVPLDLKVTVMRVLDAHSQVGLSGGRVNAGPSAWVRTAGGIDIALVSVRQQTLSPDAFTGLGITLADKAMVVVKSTQHFHAGFAPIAAEIRYISAASGAVPPDYAHIAFTKRTRPFWPRVSDPFETNR